MHTASNAPTRPAFGARRSAATAGDQFRPLAVCVPDGQSVARLRRSRCVRHNALAFSGRTAASFIAAAAAACGSPWRKPWGGCRTTKASPQGGRHVFPAPTSSTLRGPQKRAFTHVLRRGGVLAAFPNNGQTQAPKARHYHSPGQSAALPSARDALGTRRPTTGSPCRGGLVHGRHLDCRFSRASYPPS